MAARGSEAPPQLSASSNAPGAALEEGQEALRRQATLPDLQGRLIKAGLLEEYLQYRARYMAWRQGGAIGAVGEIAEVGTQRRQAPLIHQHEELVGTPQQFDFFFTVSYWVAICSTTGAMVLTFTNVAPLFDTQHRLDSYLMHWLTLLGDAIFTLSAYLNYFEFINIQVSDDQPRALLFFKWKSIRSKVRIESAIGILGYLWGQLIWDVAAIADVMPWELEGEAKWIFNRAPNLIGACGFVIGGLCEVIHNLDKSPRYLEFWAAWSNCIGCFLFLGGAICALLPDTGRAGQLAFAGGISLFVVGSVLFIMMWRSNDFGLTLLRQLNEALRAGGHVALTRTTSGSVAVRHGTAVTPGTRSSGRSPAHASAEGQEDEAEQLDRGRQRFSLRGVFFLVIYSWFIACSSMNVVVSIFRTQDVNSHIMDLVNCVLWMSVVLLVLVVHSAIGSVPNQQPYRFAMLAMRGLLLCAGVWQTVRFAEWVPEVHALAASALEHVNATLDS